MDVGDYIDKRGLAAILARMGLTGLRWDRLLPSEH